MKTNPSLRLILIALMVAVGPYNGVANPTLNYQGRIAVDGANFTGTGYFRFALLNNTADILWTQDGNQPDAPMMALAIEVNNGLFNVELGDEGLMETIPSLVFHERLLLLRTWFSDDGITFEQLNPDVRVQTLDFARFNTGRTLVVDQHGGGAFPDLQSAINAFAGGGYDLILVKQGYYEGALEIPTNSHVVIRGENRHSVWISSDETLLNMSLSSIVEIENLTLSGAPVIRDEQLPGEDDWEAAVYIRNCDLRRSSGEGAIIELDVGGDVHLFDCHLLHQEVGEIVRMGGGGSFHAAHSQFDAEAGSVLVAENGFIRIESCEFLSNGGPGVVLGGGNVYLRLIHSPVSSLSHAALLAIGQVNGRFIGVDFRSDEPDVPTIQAENISGGLQFRACEIGITSGTGPAVVLNGGTAGIRFDSCSIRSIDGVALLLENYEGGVDVDHTRIHTQNSPAIELLASEPEVDVHVQLAYSKVNVSPGAGTDPEADAIVLRNTGEKDAFVEVKLYASLVEGFARDGVRLEGPDVEIVLEAGSMIDAERNGITALDGGGVFIDDSGVAADEGYGIRLAGLGFLFVLNARMSGEQGGLWLDYDEESIAFIDRSFLLSFDGPPLTLAGGEVIVNQSTFLFAEAPGVVVGGADTSARFNRCVFTSIADLFGSGAPAPAVWLEEDEGIVPSPSFLACTFEPSVVADYAIDAEGAATITLVNSVLGKPYSGNISLNAAPVTDAFGNTVLEPAAP